MRSLDRLDAAFLARHGIRGLLWDVDGTLTRFHDTALAAEASHFRALSHMPAIHHAILSNAGEERFRELGRIFPDTPVLKGYRCDGDVVMRHIQHGQDSWTADALVSRLAAGAIPLRKPDGELVVAATRALGWDLSDAVMIGDQYLTDIAGANLAGVRSIKLPAIGPASLPPGIRIGQVLERGIYRLLHGAPVWEHEDSTVTAREG
jgi:predicted HAD superfamily phosphohydrolase YqeG